METILIILISVFLYSIKCLDVRLSLGAKFKDRNTYPVVITLKEPLIYETNPIDLYCVIDTSGSMDTKKLFHLREALNLTIDALNGNDRLSIISFANGALTKYNLSEMNDKNKEEAKKIVLTFKSGSGGTDYEAASREFVYKITNETELNDGRVKSIIFLTDGESTSSDKNATKYLKNLLKSYPQKYDFTLNSFGFNDYDVPIYLVDFSDKRDGSFYSINNTEMEKIKDYVLNVIGAMRTTSYNFVNMKIQSKYNISKIYGINHLSNFDFIDSKIFINEVFQFLTGKEYTYVLEVAIPDDVDTGEKILTIDVVFTDIYGKEYDTSDYLRFYKALGCFNCYREEYCRVWAMESLEQSMNNNTVKDCIKKINEECGDDLNPNISYALEIISSLPDNIQGKRNYIYGVISEGTLKRNGMNLWYSNEYQYELINDFLYNRDPRNFWERFHIPYWKIGFLRKIHRIIGLPLQFIYILIVLTACIPLSLISVFVFRKTGRLIFNMIVGLVIQIALFDVAFLNVFIACTVVYILLRFTKLHGGPILFSLFGYLMIVHIFHFVFYGQTLDFGASPFLFMFAIAKITFFTYAVRERNVNPAKFINQYHRYCITDENFPNYFEFLSYMYFFPSAIYGPCFQIKDYLNYIYNRDEYIRMDIKKQMRNGFIRILIGYGLISLYYFLKYTTFFQFGIFKTYEYIASDDILSMNIILRFILIYVYSIFIKCFIYGFFQLIYGIFMTTGIAYSEPITLMNLNGGPDYILDLSDKKGHCGNILKSDLGYNIGDAINNFNRSIHIYLKYCVYIRILFLPNSWIKNYFIAAIFVFLFAALWCGIYIGMYFFFIAACIIYQFHFNLELFGFYDWLDNAHIAIKIIITIIVQYILSMIFCMLFLYKIEMTWCYLRNYYFTPFIIVIGLYLVSLILRLTGFHKEKGEEKKRNRSKTKTKPSKQETLVGGNTKKY